MTKNLKKTPSLTTLSRSLIAIFSTTLLAACFTVILSPGMSPDKVAIGACLLFIALLGIGRGALWHNPGRWFWRLIGLCLTSAPMGVLPSCWPGLIKLCRSHEHSDPYAAPERLPLPPRDHCLRGLGVPSLCTEHGGCRGPVGSAGRGCQP